MPNDAYHALARLEARGPYQILLAQSVDRLHQAAGSRAVIDLHGRLDPRSLHGVLRNHPALPLPRQVGPAQRHLGRSSSTRLTARRRRRPRQIDLSGFVVPPCASCGGILKQDVVFLMRRDSDLAD
jgi:NAD-dependent SIR2 family protein deacetylase